MESDVRYPMRPVLGRLLANVRAQNPRLFLFFAVYTLAAGLYPLTAVALPKLALEELLRPEGARFETLMLTVGGIFLLAAGLGFAKSWILRHTSIQITHLRLTYLSDMLRRLVDMRYENVEDAGFYNRHELAMRATNTNESGIEGVYHLLFESPALLVTVMALAVLVGSYNVWLLPALILHVVAAFYVGRAVNAATHSMNEELGRANRRRGYFLDTTHDFGFGKDIRLYGLRSRVLGHYRQEIDNYVALMRRLARRQLGLSFWTLGALLIGDVVVYGLLIRDALNGLSIADFSMLLSAVAVLGTMLRALMDNVTKMHKEGRYAHGFFEFMALDLGEKGGDIRQAPEGTLEIAFDNVSFRYPGSEHDVIKNLNLTLKKGERLAIVGINGAGKTTLVKLLCGLFDASSGQIRINGRPIADYDKQTLYSMFSVVFQDVNVFAYPLLENVACAEDGDRERAQSALERAGLGAKVASLVKGLDHPLRKIIEEDGIELSGGEAQKLAIARALYKDASMVIMDEPTAALDALAEADIYERFAELIDGKTAIFISHRLASTKFCDNIAFFDADGLKEYGSHDALMAKQGSYYHMFTVQGKYYQTTEGGVA